MNSLLVVFLCDFRFPVTAVCVFGMQLDGT